MLRLFEEPDNTLKSKKTLAKGFPPNSLRDKGSEQAHTVLHMQLKSQSFVPISVKRRPFVRVTRRTVYRTGLV